LGLECAESVFGLRYVYHKYIEQNQTAQSSIKSAGQCGYLVAVNGNGKLPARARVLIITSESFNPSAHDFSDLQDTLYVLLQKQGNTAGHFVNHPLPAK
jgi:hypothetical protein